MCKYLIARYYDGATLYLSGIIRGRTSAVIEIANYGTHINTAYGFTSVGEAESAMAELRDAAISEDYIDDLHVVAAPSRRRVDAAPPPFSWTEGMGYPVRTLTSLEFGRSIVESQECDI